ncbi:MAG: hypothetical protein K2L56_04325, partial [Prevotella sp.]|nr:hypothetical protein [Prevotella sp.]
MYLLIGFSIFFSYDIIVFLFIFGSVLRRLLLSPCRRFIVAAECCGGVFRHLAAKIRIKLNKTPIFSAQRHWKAKIL